MTIGERIKTLRRKIGITQEEFSEKLGTSRNTITNYESGRRTPMDATIKSICREFNVSEDWLRTGEGDMFLPPPTDTLDVLTKEYDLSHNARILVEEFVGLKPEMQQVFIDFARKAAANFHSESTVPATPQKQETDLAAQVAKLERQNQELAAEIAAMREQERRAPQDMTDEELRAELDRQLLEEKNRAENSTVSGPTNSDTATG